MRDNRERKRCKVREITGNGKGASAAGFPRGGALQVEGWGCGVTAKGARSYQLIGSRLVEGFRDRVRVAGLGQGFGRRGQRLSCSVISKLFRVRARVQKRCVLRIEEQL